MSDKNVLSVMWKDEVDFDSWALEMLGGKNGVHEDFDPDEALANIPRTDIVASRAIVKKIGSRLSYVSASKTWYVWDGRIHTPVDSDVVAKNVVYKLFDSIVEALDNVDYYYETIASRYYGSEDKDDKKRLKEIEVKWAKVKEFKRYRDNLGDNRGAVSLVKAMETAFHRSADYFDKDQDYLVVRNGVFLTNQFTEQGWPQLIKHSSDLPVSKYIDANWDPSCYNTFENSKFHDFLHSSMINGDQEIIDYLQQCVAAAFLGRKKLRTIPNLIGPPSSGKSLFVETVFGLGNKGAGYCAMPDAIAITRQQQNWEQSKFRGRRFIAISEPDSKKEIDDEFLKRFTGDVWVETRNLREKSQGWAPQGMLFIASNSNLRINTRDQAIVDRVKIINFPYTFTPNPDPEDPMQKPINTNLTDELQEENERSNILFWIIDGIRKFRLGGEVLDSPQSVKDESAKVVTEGSAATRWIADQISEGTLSNTPGDEIYHNMKLSEAWSDFSLWNAINNEHSRLSKRFFEADIAQWYEIVQHGSDKYIVGLRKVNSNDRVPA